VGLRVGVKKTGCSGFAYVVNYADEIHPGDAVFEERGVKIVVDSASLPLIDGTLVDFVKQGASTRRSSSRIPRPRSSAAAGRASASSAERRRARGMRRLRFFQVIQALR
jgi:iron-sulfur cluster assembly protein